MEQNISNILRHDVMALDRAGIDFDIIDIRHMRGYDVYEIKIIGDKAYIDTALRAIGRP